MNRGVHIELFSICLRSYTHIYTMQNTHTSKRERKIEKEEEEEEKEGEPWEIKPKPRETIVEP